MPLMAHFQAKHWKHPEKHRGSSILQTLFEYPSNAVLPGHKSSLKFSGKIKAKSIWAKSKPMYMVVVDATVSWVLLTKVANEKKQLSSHKQKFQRISQSAKIRLPKLVRKIP